MAKPVSQELHELRLEAGGWSLRELARRSGVGLSYLGRLQRGEAVRPQPAVLNRLARAFAGLQPEGGRGSVEQRAALRDSYLRLMRAAGHVA